MNEVVIERGREKHNDSIVKATRKKWETIEQTNGKDVRLSSEWVVKQMECDDEGTNEGNEGGANIIMSGCEMVEITDE